MDTTAPHLQPKCAMHLGSQAKAEASYFLTTLFPSNQLYIMDYNRVVKDLNELTEAGLLEKLGASFTIEKAATAVAPANLHQFGMYLKGQWVYTNCKRRYLDPTILLACWMYLFCRTWCLIPF